MSTMHNLHLATAWLLPGRLAPHLSTLYEDHPTRSMSAGFTSFVLNELAEWTELQKDFISGLHEGAPSKVLRAIIDMHKQGYPHIYWPDDIGFWNTIPLVAYGIDWGELEWASFGEPLQHFIHPFIQLYAGNLPPREYEAQDLHPNLHVPNALLYDGFALDDLALTATPNARAFIRLLDHHPSRFHDNLASLLRWLFRETDNPVLNLTDDELDGAQAVRISDENLAYINRLNHKAETLIDQALKAAHVLNQSPSLMRLYSMIVEQIHYNLSHLIEPDTDPALTDLIIALNPVQDQPLFQL